MTAEQTARPSAPCGRRRQGAGSTSPAEAVGALIPGDWATPWWLAGVWAGADVVPAEDRAGSDRREGHPPRRPRRATAAAAPTSTRGRSSADRYCGRQDGGTAEATRGRRRHRARAPRRWPPPPPTRRRRGHGERRRRRTCVSGPRTSCEALPARPGTRRHRRQRGRAARRMARRRRAPPRVEMRPTAARRSMPGIWSVGHWVWHPPGIGRRRCGSIRPLRFDEPGPRQFP